MASSAASSLMPKRPCLKKNGWKIGRSSGLRQKARTKTRSPPRLKSKVPVLWATPIQGLRPTRPSLLHTLLHIPTAAYTSTNDLSWSGAALIHSP